MSFQTSETCMYVVPLSNTKEDILKNILLFHDPKGISSFENGWIDMLLSFTTWIKSEMIHIGLA